MKVSSIFRQLFAKNNQFYDLFEESTAHLREIGDLFHEFVESESSRRARLFIEMENVEHANDILTHTLFNQLSRNFITPFDREDIHYLSGILDDIIDYIWNAAKRITDFNIVEKDPYVIDFTARIILILEEVDKAIHELRHIRRGVEILESCDRIHAMTNECNDMLDNASTNLFTTDSADPIDVIRKLDLYDLLQVVTDKCGDTANILESIIVKYS